MIETTGSERTAPLPLLIPSFTESDPRTKERHMTLPAQVRAVWKSAELLIAFHKNKHREKRDTPYLWSPKDAFARLLAAPEDQEAFIMLKGEADHADVQIKMHPDKLVIRRDQPLGWSGILIDEDTVRVKVDNIWIRIDATGRVVVEKDAETTYLEEDGEIIKISPDAEIIVSADGARMSRRTEAQIDAFTEDGFVSRKHPQRPANELEKKNKPDA